MATAAERFFRGGVKYELAQFLPIAHQPMGKRSPFLHVVRATGVPSGMRLPDARNLQLGGPYFLITKPVFNSDPGISINDHAGIGLFSIDDPEAALLWLVDNTTEGGEWIWQIKDAYLATDSWSDDFSTNPLTSSRDLDNNINNDGADFAYDAVNDELDVSQTLTPYYATAHYNGWPQVQNLEIEALMEIAGGTADKTHRLMLLVRWDPATENGYGFALVATDAAKYTAHIFKVTGGAVASLGSSVTTINVGTAAMVKGKIDGDALQMKWWVPPASEPGSWELSETDSTYTARNYMGFGHIFTLGGGAPGPSTNPTIDDLFIQGLPYDD